MGGINSMGMFSRMAMGRQLSAAEVILETTDLMPTGWVGPLEGDT